MEKFEPKTEKSLESERMDLKEAQEEANMIRSKMGLSPESGKIADKWEDQYGLGKEATAEDYEHALEAVEQMKQLASEEPTSEKIMNELKRIAEHTKLSAVVLLNLFVPAGGSGSFELSHDHRIKALEDASQRLKMLKKESKKFEN